MKKFLLALVFIVIGGALISGFSAYREISREGYCSDKIQKLQTSNPQIDWKKQVPAAPLGFSKEVKTVPLTLAGGTKCQHEQKDFFLF